MNNEPLLPLGQYVVYKKELKASGPLTEVNIVLPDNVKNFRIKDGQRHIGIYLYWDHPESSIGKSVTFRFLIVWTGHQFKVPEGHILEFIASTWDRNEMFHIYLLKPLDF